MTTRQAAAVALIATLALGACAHPGDSTGQGPRADASACPEDDVLEALHNAVFFLEHRRDVERALRDVERIRGRVNSDSPGAAMVLPLVGRIADLAARDGVLEPDSEVIRAELHASPCITAELHGRFHRALPPLP